MRILRTLPEPSVVADFSGRILAANPAAVRLLKLDPGNVEGASLLELCAGDEEEIRRFLRLAAGSGTMIPSGLRLRGDGDGVSRLGCRACAMPNGANGTPEAIFLRFDANPDSGQRFLALTQTVEELRKESAERKIAEESLRRSEGRAQFLADASEILASSLDYETTLRNVAKLAVPRFADWCAVDLVDESGQVVRVAVEHTDPKKVEFVYEIQERYPPNPNAPQGAHEIIRTGKSELIPEIPDELLVQAAVDEEHLRLIRRLGLHSYVGAPLQTRDGTIGVLTMVWAESQRVYTDADLHLLEDLGRRAGTAIENSRLVRDLEEARDRIQEQAVELESQAEELQTQAMHLEDQAVELERQVEEAQLLNEELISTNQELEAARQEAERASSAKSQFLTVMSHELRTPMNAIVGYTDLLDQEIAGPVNEKQKMHLSRIRASTSHLLGLINQVLSLARIEAGREEIAIEETDIADAVGQVASMMEPLVQRKSLSLKIEIDPDVPTIDTDAGKLRQILMNLVSNAVKFTREGTIRITASKEGEDLLISVSDTGVGIRPEHLDRIFGAFEQLERELSSEAEGTGLGLAVSRELATLMGGELRAESEFGKGSRFTLRLPVE